MVRAHPILEQRVKVYQNSLIYKDRSIKSLSHDANTAHGLNPNIVICDEIASWMGQRGREFYEVLTTAQGARQQPLTLIIGTAGYDRQSIAWEIDQYATRVRDGIVDDSTFAGFIYRIDEEDDWTDIEVLRKANPSLGQTVSGKYLQQQIDRARNSPSFQNSFRRLHANQWTESESRYLTHEAWDACAFRVDAEELRGRRCYGGLDLANTTDLAAFVLTFPPEEEDEPYQILPFFWIPKDNLRDRVMRDNVKYDLWVKDGFIFTTEGNIIDHNAIIAKILELSQIYNIEEIAFDRWGSVQVSNTLQGEGIEMVQFGHRFASMSSPTKHLETLTLSKKLAHGGNPVLAWNISNLTVESDAAGNVKPSKKASSEKIDGAVALIMSLDSAIVDDPRAKRWSFDEMYEAFDQQEEMTIAI
jgi:phage terminase large subunit-like protein